MIEQHPQITAKDQCGHIAKLIAAKHLPDFQSFSDMWPFAKAGIQKQSTAINHSSIKIMAMRLFCVLAGGQIPIRNAVTAIIRYDACHHVGTKHDMFTCSPQNGRTSLAQNNASACFTIETTCRPQPTPTTPPLTAPQVAASSGVFAARPSRAPAAAPAAPPSAAPTSAPGRPAMAPATRPPIAAPENPPLHMPAPSCLPADEPDTPRAFRACCTMGHGVARAGSQSRGCRVANSSGGRASCLRRKQAESDFCVFELRYPLPDARDCKHQISEQSKTSQSS